MVKITPKKNKAYIKIVLLLANIAVMVFSACHFFCINQPMGMMTVAYGVAFLMTFAVYCYLRYKSETESIGKWSVVVMLAGMVLALFGASNVLLGSVPESLVFKYACYVMLIIGAALYGWNNYKSERSLETE